MKVDENKLNGILRREGYTPNSVHSGLKTLVEKNLAEGKSTDLGDIYNICTVGPDTATGLAQLAYDRAEWKGQGEKPAFQLTTPTLENLTIGEREISHDTRQWRINIDPTYVFRFIMVSDTHLGSRHDNIEGLQEMFKEGIDAGVVAVLHAGDLTDGYFRRHRDMFKYLRPECLGLDGQLEYVVEKWPTGIPTYYIGGNHDHFLMDTGDADICKHIAKYRSDDMFYLKEESVRDALGRTDLDPETMKKVLEAKKLGSGRIGALKMGPAHLRPDQRHTIHMLMHPGDGSSQAFSYRPQRIIAAIDGILDTFEGLENPRGKRIKPHFLQIGHYHKRLMSMIRGVRVFQSACGKYGDQFHEVKSLWNMMGYWIIDVNVQRDGNPVQVTQSFRSLMTEPTRATRTVVKMRK